MIGVTIGNARWREAAEVAARTAREKTGCPVRILGEAEWDRYRHLYPHPAFMKFHLFDLVDADDLFYFDADAVFLNPWDPRPYSGSREFIAVWDNLVGDAASEAAVPREEYFNSGFMILNRRHHEPVLRRAEQLFKQGMRSKVLEQSHLVQARKECEVPLRLLGREHNHLRFQDEPASARRSIILGHWTCLGPEPTAVEVYGRTGNVFGPHTAAELARAFLKTIRPYPDGCYQGRGIVICAGGVRYGVGAWVLAKLLRNLGCRLPIEVWYRGAEEGDPAWIELLRSQGVNCIDSFEVRRQYPHPRLGGWELKPYAMLHSRFEEVLLLDADNVPVRDPSFLFDSPQYLETGAIFWPDLSPTPPDSPRWRIFGIPYREEPEQESGQVVVNKRRCWTALNLCNWYNENSHFYYQYVYGDKDTFRFSWHAAGQPFAMIPRLIEQVGVTLLQYDFAGQLLFQHRCGDKWSLAGNRRIPRFRHEAACHGFVDELRKRWSPVWFLARGIAAADLARMTTLSGARFDLVRPGYNRWPVRLGPNGFVAEGWTPTTFFWWLEDGQLIMAGDDGRQTCRLAEKTSGVWEGRSLRERSMTLRLVSRSSLVA